MAGKISDKELRLRQLRLKNAYDQRGLILRQIAEGDQLVDLVNIYEHENWPKEKVYCSQCNGHHHRDGFTALVVAASGALVKMLFGSKCGQDAFGHDWRTAEKRIEGQKDRQWELARLDRLEPVQNELQMALQDWRNRIPKIVGRKSAFSLRMGELSSRLYEGYTQYNGNLFVHRTMLLKNGSRHLDTQIIEPIRGAEIFNSLDMIAAVDRAQTALKSMSESIGVSETVPTKTLQKRRREFEKCFQELHTVYSMYEGAQDFFTAESFSKIVEWTKRYAVTDKRYSWNGKVIEDKDGWNEFALPEPFDDLSSDPLHLIAEYRRAD